MTSATVESQPVSMEQHTPFCDNRCSIQHHPLLQTIIRLPGNLGVKDKAELQQCITKYKAHGWNLDDPIPDTVSEFRYPMLHWVAAMSKPSLANYLVKEGCTTTKQTKQGDTPLHRCIICLKPKNKRAHLLVSALASNLPVCNAKGQTPLLLLAERLDHGQITPDQFSDWLMTILDATMKMVDVGQRLKTFNTQNQQGDTALHLLCNVRNMLPSVRRMVQEARCNVKIRNKLGLTAMDVAVNSGYYDYVTEIKSVLPTGSLVSPLRSSHPMGKGKKSPSKSRHSLETSRTRDSDTSKKVAKKRSRSMDIRQKEVSISPPKLERMKTTTATTKLDKTKTPSAPAKLVKIKTPTAPTEDNTDHTKESETPPLSPLSLSAKRPRKGTPYRVNRQEEEQRLRASNLDRILQSQCQGTPVKSDRVVKSSEGLRQASTDGSGQSSDSNFMDVDNGASTSGQETDDDKGQHSSGDDRCVLCNLESGSKIRPHLENGSKVSELQVSTAAAAGTGVASEPGASGDVGDDKSKANSKLLDYLHMHKDFQKEIISKIHKDQRELEKTIMEQEGSIQVTAKELAKVTSESYEVNREKVTTIQQLEPLQAKVKDLKTRQENLQAKEKDLKTRQEKLRKLKKAKELQLGEKRTQLAVIAQSLLELQG